MSEELCRTIRSSYTNFLDLGASLNFKSLAFASKGEAPGAFFDYSYNKNLEYFLFDSNSLQNNLSTKIAKNVMIKDISDFYFNVFSKLFWKESINLSDIKKMFSKELSLSNSKCVLAINNGEIAGFISGYPTIHKEISALFNNQNVFFISHLGVSKDFRNNNIGEIMTTHIYNEIVEAKYNGIVARIDKNVKPSQKICQKFGLINTNTSSIDFPNRFFWVKKLSPHIEMKIRSNLRPRTI